MIADPPLLTGAVQVKETCVLPAVPATDVGAPGTVRGVTADDVTVAPVPMLLMALTRNVYDVPFTKPVTVVPVVADVPSANVAQETPSLNSTT